MTRLGDLISPVTGRAGSSSYPVYSVTKHAGFVPSAEYFKKQVYSNDVSTYKVVERGQFAYATIHLDEGSIGIAPEACIISPMYTVFAADSARVDNSFLIRYLKSPLAMSAYPRLGRGTAERRKSISLEALGRLEVPLPPLPEQRRIAAILDEADAVRARAKAGPRFEQDFEKGLYLATFGDPRSVASVPLLDVVRPQSGGTPSKATLEFWRGSIPWVSPKDMKSNNLFDAIDHVSESAIELTTLRLLPPDTVAIVVRGMILAHSVPVARIRVASTINQDMKALLPKAPIDAAFLAASIRIQSSSVLAAVSAAGHGTRRLDAEGLESIRIPIATFEQQARFGSTIAAVEEVGSKLASEATELDELFASLQHRAFRGEL